MSYRVRPQIIVSENYKKQKQLTDRLRKQAATADKREAKSRDKWADKLKPLKGRLVSQYAKYWYAEGRAA